MKILNQNIYKCTVNWIIMDDKLWQIIDEKSVDEKYWRKVHWRKVLRKVHWRKVLWRKVIPPLIFSWSFLLNILFKFFTEINVFKLSTKNCNCYSFERQHRGCEFNFLNSTYIIFMFRKLLKLILMNYLKAMKFYKF